MSLSVSRFIETARWIAAFIVGLFHVAGILYVLGPIVGAPALSPPFLFLFLPSYAFAHEAVVVFFVLSGFLVGGAVIQRSRKAAPWLADYAVDRTVRIYIVLLPVLAVCGALDLIGAHVFRSLGVYQSSFYTQTFSPLLVVTNILNWQGIWFAPFGTNQPMWSLGMEYWYYATFAFVVLPFAPAISAYPARRRAVAGLVGLAMIAAYAAGGSYFLFGFALWFIGALVRIAPVPLVRSRALSLAAFLLASVAARLFVPDAALPTAPWKYIVDGVETLLFANLLLTLRFDTSEGFRFCRLNFHRRLAAFSYTFYACHMPVAISLYCACLYLFGDAWRRAIASPAYYAIYVVLVAGVTAVAYTLARLTEAHTAEVRAWARRILRTPLGLAANRAGHRR